MSKEQDYKDNFINDTQRCKKALQTFKHDLKFARQYREPNIAKIYKSRKEYSGEKYGNEIKGRSSIVLKEIRKYAQQLIAEIIDPFVRTPDIIKCMPLNINSIDSAINNEKLLNFQFCNQLNRYKFMYEVCETLCIDGTVVIKTGWEYNEDNLIVKKKVPYQTNILDPNTGQYVIDYKDVIEEDNVVIANKPDVFLCRNEDIYIDPTCRGNTENIRFLVHRIETDIASLQSKPDIYFNIDQVKQNQIGNNNTPDMTFDDTFEDTARKKIEMYEYWGYYDLEGNNELTSIVCSWIDDTVVRFETNKLPDQKIPFIICPLLPKSGSIYGESICETLSDMQKVKTSIIRGLLDSLARSNSGQVGIKKGELDDVNMRRFLEGNNFVYNNDPRYIYNATFNPIPNSTFNFFSLLTNECEGLSGITTNLYNQSNSSLGEYSGSSLNTNGKYRKLAITSNISEGLIKPLLRKWTCYNRELLDEETMIFMNGSNNIETINKNNLYGEIEFIMKISTNEDNEQKARNLSFLLQTTMQQENPEVRKIIVSEIFRLYSLHNVADMIDSYQYQPSEYEQAIQQLTIQKLQAEINTLNAQANNYNSNSELRVNKNATEYAKAENISAKTQQIIATTQNREINNSPELAKFQLQERKMQNDYNIATMNNQTKLALESMKQNRAKSEDLNPYTSDDSPNV